MKTMNRIITLIVFLCFAISVKAQDTLIMANGAYLPAKVIEVNTSEIKYKKADNPDGPTFVISKAEVSSIRYKNGTVDKIVYTTPQNSAPINNTPQYIAPPPPPPDPKIYQSGSRYISDGHRFGNAELYNKLLSANDMKITSEVRKAKTGAGLKYLTLGMIPCFIGGVATLISETVNGNGPTSSTTDYTTAVPWFAGGVVFLGTGIGFSISHNSHKKKAIELYNQKF